MPNIGDDDGRENTFFLLPMFYLQMLRSSMTAMMRAVVVHEFGGVKKMKVETDMPAPSVGEHEVCRDFIMLWRKGRTFLEQVVAYTLRKERMYSNLGS